MSYNNLPNNSSDNDPSHWVLGVFYFNKEDKRLLPSKRNPVMGWTINFANPLSVLLLITVALGLFLLSRFA